MKVVKKLMALVLASALALTLLTGCGGGGGSGGSVSINGTTVTIGGTNNADTEGSKERQMCVKVQSALRPRKTTGRFAVNKPLVLSTFSGGKIN